MALALISGNTISDNGANAIDASGGLTVGTGSILNYTFVTPDFSTAITQGYTFDGTYHYFFGTNYISKRDASFNVVLDNTNPLSGITGVDHLGDGVYLGGFLYAPVETYPAVTGMRIAKYDATTLALVTTYSISAQTHEASSIATDGSILYISSYDDGTKIWKYSLTGVFISATTMATPFTNNVQGISYYNGKLYVVEQSKYGSVNIDGSGYQFIGNLPGTIGHRGEGIQVVNGISRVVVINDGVSAGNLFYFDNTTSGTKPFSVDTTGRIAIGIGATATTNTTTKLELVTSSTTDQTMLLQNTNAAATSSMAFKDSAGTKFLTIGIANPSNALGTSYSIAGESFLRTSSAAVGLSFNVIAGPIKFMQQNPTVERMRVANTTGNILIGTTTDTGERLQVSGSSKFTSDINVNGLTIGLGNSNIAQNTALGVSTLLSNTTGNFNVAVGRVALTSNTTGNNNTGIGYAALQNNNIGVSNTAIGFAALFNISATANNVGLGSQAGRYLSDGSTSLTAASSSLFVGTDTKASANGLSNEIVIGNSAIGNGSNSVTLGNTSVTKTILQGNVGIGTTTGTTLLNLSGVFSAETPMLSLQNTNTSGTATTTSTIEFKTNAFPSNNLKIGFRNNGDSYFYNTSGSNLRFGVNGLTGIGIYGATGNVSIGSSVDNGNKLYVNGDIKATGLIYTPTLIQSDNGLYWGNSIGYAGDINDANSGGVLAFATPLDNQPPLDGNYTLIVEKKDNNNGCQKATHIDSGRIFVRENVSGSWTAWKEIVTAAPYKKYVAIMTQMGTVFTNSDVTVLDNTIGNITWSYVTVGQYLGTLSGAFTSGKVVAFSNTGAGGTGFMQMFRIDDDTFKINTKDYLNTAANGIMTEASIEIRVYQ